MRGPIVSNGVTGQERINIRARIYCAVEAWLLC
jgi:hypothetical protein